MNNKCTPLDRQKYHYHYPELGTPDSSSGIEKQQVLTETFP